jgi:hypothetical protein
MNTTKIDSNNICFNSSNKTYRIRGFEDIILSHLRVNIKVIYKDNFFIDIVDLYSQKSRKLFLNRVYNQLKLNREEVKKDLYKIIDIIEKYQSDKKNPPKKEPIKISNEDKETALKYLKSPNLLKNIMLDIESLGYIGEENNKSIAYLVSISRKLTDPLSCIIISESSAGKSALSDCIERLTPPEDIVYLSTLTPKALYYMDKDHLKHKFVIIEEREGSYESDYPIRILQSKKRLIQAIPIKDPNTNKTRTHQIEVEGPISYLETTTKSHINYENSTRCFELYLDSSQSQTSRIHQIQKESKTLIGLERRLKLTDIISKHHNMQRLLQKVNIINPYSNYINFPTKYLRTRRDHLRFLNLIEVITFLHQYQRPKKTIDDTEYIESTPKDYRIAYELYSELIQHTLSDLNKPQKELLVQIKAMAKEKNLDLFSRKDIRDYTGYPHHKVRDITKDLADLEYLIVQSYGNGKRTLYRLNDVNTQEGYILKALTKPEELVEYITSTG